MLCFTDVFFEEQINYLCLFLYPCHICEDFTGKYGSVYTAHDRNLQGKQLKRNNESADYLSPF
jgi:hypothetical protein